MKFESSIDYFDDLKESWRNIPDKGQKSGEYKSNETKKGQHPCPKCGRGNGLVISFDEISPYKKCKYPDCNYFERF